MLYSKMSSKAWGEYSLWFYGSAEALPDHEIDMIESVLVGVIAKVWMNCIPEFQSMATELLGQHSRDECMLQTQPTVW